MKKIVNTAMISSKYTNNRKGERHTCSDKLDLKGKRSRAEVRMVAHTILEKIGVQGQGS